MRVEFTKSGDCGPCIKISASNQEDAFTLGEMMSDMRSKELSIWKNLDKNNVQVTLPCIPVDDIGCPVYEDPSKRATK